MSVQSDMHDQNSTMSDVSGSRLRGADRHAYTAVDDDMNNIVAHMSLIGSPSQAVMVTVFMTLRIMHNPEKESIA
jgi:hypothetical protein